MNNLKFPSKEQMFSVFENILKNPETCKLVLTTPSVVFKQNGLEVSDPSFIDSQFFVLFPQLKNHFLLGASGKPHVDALLGCSSPACIACKSATAISATAAIVAAVAGFPEDTPLIDALAEIVGLDPETIIGILEGTSNVGDIIDGICQALGTC